MNNSELTKYAEGGKQKNTTSIFSEHKSKKSPKTVHHAASKRRKSKSPTKRRSKSPSKKKSSTKKK